LRGGGFRFRQEVGGLGPGPSPGPPNLPPKCLTPRIWSTIFSKGPIFSFEKCQIPVEKVRRSAISWGPATPLLNYIGKTPLTEEILEVQSGIDRIISLFGESESAELVEAPRGGGVG